MASEKQYIDLFLENRKLIDDGSCAPMNALRDKALKCFRKKGFPSRKVEEYKYTDVDKAFAPDYGVNLRRVEFAVDPAQAFRCSISNIGTTCFFMVGDRFVHSPQSRDWHKDGLFIGSLAEYARKNPEFVEKYYGKLVSVEKNPLAALNTMLAQDGLLVHVEKDVKIANPLQVVNLGRAGMDLMTNRRVLVVLESGAETGLLFCDHNLDHQKFLTTQVGEIWMGEGSCLRLGSVDETDEDNTFFNNVTIRQERNSCLKAGFFTLNGGTTRRTACVELVGEGATANVFGGIIDDDHEHTDNNLLIDHKVGGCSSDILFKYVLDGESVGAFAGKVLVRKGAQKTDSIETNANLCVSPKARMFTQPMLEIYADDVKCNHGSTVGKLDETAKFYMAQRGIPEAEAEILLQQAFLDEAIRRIPLEPLRERVSQMVEHRIRHKMSGCSGCALCGTKIRKEDIN